jgi:DNA gyrase subunit A
MEIGLIKKVDIDQEMQQSYLDYAMSVIVARALPDARDGLKPVQRRILYAMYDMGLRPGSGYRKSARIVGEVLGKYHPHGDVAVYEAMARLVQDFSMRYPLVDGQGNFGSIDGDPPAAMRYTEASLLPTSMEILAQIERDTVDFIDNFDSTLREPEVLPAALPNLLLNGASGIAVGMATNIPPHNLSELIDAMVFMLGKWDRLDDVTATDLMNYVKGPDFPTGGIILQEEGKNDILNAYVNGKARITVRGLVQLEEMSRGRNRIIVTELPYMTNKTSFIERVADLAREDKIEGISDLRDESNRQGMRIVIELSKSADVDNVLRNLYQRTPLQSTFGIAMLALVNSEPRLLPLKQALRVYIEHRITVVRRRSEYDLEKARAREHILAGLLIAISNLDDIIALIRRSQDTDQARGRLMRKYKLTEIQANAILDMPLKRLSALERKKLDAEYKEVTALIKELEKLLRSPRKIRQVVTQDLQRIRETYGDRRKTQIVTLGEGESAKGLLTFSDLMPAEEVWVGVTPEGVLARSPSNNLPRSSGREAAQWILKTNTHHTVFFSLEDGRAASVAVSMLPESERFHEGVSFTKLSPFRQEELLASVFSTPAKDHVQGERYILTVSRFGMVKKSAIDELPGPTPHEFVLAKINEDDALIKTILTDGQSDICLVTARGMIIRFSESDVRPMGLVAAGVNGIKLADDDHVVAAERIIEGCEILLLASDGTGWHFDEKSLPIQGRYGQGVIACRLNADVELVGMMLGKNTQTGVVHFQKAAAKYIRVDAIPKTRRNTAGKQAMQIKEDDEVYTIAPVWDELAFWEEAPKAVVKKKSRKRN